MWLVASRAIAGDPLTCTACATPLGAPLLHGTDRLHGTPGRFAVVRCESCGAGRTLPPLEDADLASLYPSDYGPYDDRMSLPVRAVSWVIRRMQARVSWRGQPVRALSASAPGRGLDVGCGRGDLAAMLARHGWRMSGLEPSPRACEVARRRGVDARRGTLATVELQEDAYDAVIFRHSLEHTGDPARDLRRVAAALAPGGLLLITVPNFGCWQARRFAGCWYHLDLPRHRTHFTEPALRKMLEAAGMECLSVGTTTSAVGLPGSIQYRVLGRCVFPGGLSLRIAGGLATLTRPVAQLLNRLAGGGDELHVVARRAESQLHAR
jgi:SAM-dependent methyltransferase